MKKVIVASVVVVAGLLSLWFYGRPAYRHYRETQAAQQARSFMTKGDYRNASLSARQALTRNPRNLDACRVAAELAELSRSPAALDLRRRVAEIEPTVGNKLLVASTAMQVQGPPYPLAAQVLEEIQESAKGVAAYQAVAAELALKLKNPGEAATRFERASQLEPTNELYQLNLAVLRLQSTNATVATESRAVLERLRTSPQFGAAALRWLVAENMRREDLAAAERFSKLLLSNKQCVPEDRLQHLAILRQAKSPEFTNYLGAAQKSVLTNAAEVYGLSTWMVGHGLVDEALGWLTNCPVKVRSEQPVPLAVVDCYLVKKDWGALETFLLEQKWTDRECLRWAFLSKTASEQKQALAADARWRSAIREAGGRLGPLTALLGLAGSWGKDKAKEDLLWQIAQKYPGERWALRELERNYQAASNTYGLNKVYATMASYDAHNFVAQNNLAATSLLLRMNLPRAHEVAKEMYAQHSAEPIVASTYAYSLHLQGHTKEGLAVFGKLKPATLETPPVALYYGVLLSAAGDTNQAGKYLDIGRTANCLPEEKALVTEAIKRLQSGG
jgi:predicted Zn-dependent protease